MIEADEVKPGRFNQLRGPTLAATGYKRGFFFTQQIPWRAIFSIFAMDLEVRQGSLFPLAASIVLVPDGSPFRCPPEEPLTACPSAGFFIWRFQCSSLQILWG